MERMMQRMEETMKAIKAPNGRHLIIRTINGVSELPDARSEDDNEQDV